MKQSIIVWNKQIVTGKPMHFPIALTNRLCPNPHDGLPLRSKSFFIYLEIYMEFYNSDFFLWNCVYNSMKLSNIVWNTQIFTGKPMHFPIAITNRLCPNHRDGIRHPP